MFYCTAAAALRLSVTCLPLTGANIEVVEDEIPASSTFVGLARDEARRP